MTELTKKEFKCLKIPGEAKVILDSFSKIETGEIEFISPEKLVVRYRGTRNGPKVKLEIYDWSIFTEILNKSDIGLAETYIESKWNVDSIANLIELSILNEKSLRKAFTGNLAKIIYYRLKHEARENTKAGSKKNIQAHYDLGNQFYTLWLDKTMTYSSALFSNDLESLEQAQQNKYQRMLNQLSLKPGDHILEIGCGWGGFLEHAGRQGVRVTGITISDEQFNYATERIKKLGLTHLLDVKLCDYRDLEGSFDHAVSIEMIEAVGEKYWLSYFDLFKRVLKKNGTFAIQAITMDDAHFKNYKKGTDFIQQYIFPGGLLLSENTLRSLCAQNNYQVHDLFYFGLDYAKTLRLWGKKFNQELESIKQLGFDDKFIRLWNFYLDYCEGAFKARRINVVQLSGRI